MSLSFSISDNPLINSIYDVLSEHQLEYVPYSERYSEIYLLNAAKKLYQYDPKTVHEFIKFMAYCGLAGELFSSACSDIWKLIQDYSQENL